MLKLPQYYQSVVMKNNFDGLQNKFDGLPAKAGESLRGIIDGFRSQLMAGFGHNPQYFWCGNAVLVCKRLIFDTFSDSRQRRPCCSIACIAKQHCDY